VSAPRLPAGREPDRPPFDRRPHTGPRPGARRQSSNPAAGRRSGRRPQLAAQPCGRRLLPDPAPLPAARGAPADAVHLPAASATRLTREETSMNELRRRLLGGLAIIGSGAVTGAANAQGTWPERPVRMISPYGAGGS